MSIRTYVCKHCYKRFTFSECLGADSSNFSCGGCLYKVKTKEYEDNNNKKQDSKPK